MSDWLKGLLAMCVQRTEHVSDKKEDQGPLLEALIPNVESPPPKADESKADPPKEKPWSDTKKRLKMADIGLAGLGLWVGVLVMGILEPQLGVPLFAPPMMASGIIFFAGPAPPSPKPFLFGTFGSATLSLGALLVMSKILPPIAASGFAAAMLLMWYKTTNVLFPPAAVLAGSLMAAFVGTASDTHPGLMEVVHFLAFPWLIGHAWLYIVAMIMSKVRGQARVRLAAAAFSTVEQSLTDDEMKQIFKKFDTSGDGALDAEELKVALRVALGVDLSVDDCKAMIAQYDKDGTESVDFSEFLLICRG